MTSYHNAQLDVIIKTDGEEFVIIGDDEAVTDADILALAEGNVPTGWEVSL